MHELRILRRLAVSLGALARGMPFRFMMALLVVVLPGTAGRAQDSTPIKDTLVIDHTDRSAWYISGKSQQEIKEGAKLRIPPSDQILVMVRRTNSALYDYIVKTEVSAAPEITALRSYLSSLGPYALELGTMLFYEPGRFWLGALTGVIDCAPASNMRDHLVALDRYIRGRNGDEAQLGLLDIRWRSLRVIQETVQESGDRSTTRVDELADALKRQLPIVPGHRGQERLALVDSVTLSLEGLRTERGGLEDASRHPGCVGNADVKTVSDKADEALKEGDAVLAAAYDTERLALTVASARSAKILDTVAVSLDSAVSVELNVAPKSRPEFRRLADQRPLTFKLGLRPRWIIVPAVGLSLLYSPDSRFSTFGTQAAPGDSADVVVSGLQDRRFSWAFALSLTPFGGLVERKLPTPWLDLAINPSDAIRGLGLGGAVSWRFLKLGAGALWTKHTELNGQVVGQRLKSAGSLVTRETYGKPEWYFGLSVIGIPPFVK